MRLITLLFVLVCSIGHSQKSMHGSSIEPSNTHQTSTAVVLEESKSNYSCTNFSELSSLNTVDTVDSYPFLSHDGLTLYYTSGTPSRLYYSKRNSLSSDFESKSLVSNIWPSHVTSCWLTNDELEIYFIRSLDMFYANRATINDTFGLASLVTLNGMSQWGYRAGASLLNDQSQMYLWWEGPTLDSGRIYILDQTSPLTFDVVDSLDQITGYKVVAGQLTKDGLGYYMGIQNSSSGHYKLIKYERSSLIDDFITYQELCPQINTSLNNAMATTNATEDVLIWSRAPIDYWEASDMFMTTGDFSNLSEQDEQKIEIYPNPVKDILYVQSDIERPLDVELFNLQGSLMYSSEHAANSKVAIDMKKYDQGMYLLRLRQGDIVISKTVIR